MLRLRIKTYITYRKCPVPLIKKFWIRTGCLYGKTTHFIISSGHTFLLFVKTFDFNLNLKWFCLVWELSLPPCISLMYHKLSRRFLIDIWKFMGLPCVWMISLTNVVFSFMCFSSQSLNQCLWLYLYPIQHLFTDKPIS